MTTLGCGGTLLKHVASGDCVHWIVFTCISTELDFLRSAFSARRRNPSRHRVLWFAGTHLLNFPTMQLDRVPKADLVAALGALVNQLAIHTLYIPYRNEPTPTTRRFLMLAQLTVLPLPFRSISAGL